MRREIVWGGDNLNAGFEVPNNISVNNTSPSFEIIMGSSGTTPEPVVAWIPSATTITIRTNGTNTGTMTWFIQAQVVTIP
jgi:hypothetical protein